MPRYCGVQKCKGRPSLYGAHLIQPLAFPQGVFGSPVDSYKKDGQTRHARLIMWLSHKLSSQDS